MKRTRPSWEEYALRLAAAASTRSEDPYVRVGAVVLRHDHSVAGCGYNGPPAGIDIDWSSRTRRRGLVVHAEANALRYCRPGEGALLACTLSPCPECLKLIAAQRIPRIVYRKPYTTDEEAFRESVSLSLLYGIEMKALPYGTTAPDSLRLPELPWAGMGRPPGM